MKIFVFNGWAATPDNWKGCAFGYDRMFSYLEHLSGESLRAVAAEEEVILIGFSMGATFVQQAILEYPDKIRGAVFVSSTPRMMESKAEGWAGMSLRRKRALKIGTQMMNPDNPSPIFAEANLDAGLNYLEVTDLRAQLLTIAGKTRFPVAIFHSTKDGIVRPHNAFFLQSVFPQATITWVEGQDHDLPAKVPELITSAVKGIWKCAVKLPRGLIEVSNRCGKNCSYCGIRRDSDLKRYHLTEAEVLACAAEAVRRGYPAIALQAGELESEANTAFYEAVLRRLPEGLEVTLSLGEQSEETYRRWKTAAGNRVLRYLLRIETSNRELYAKIHPADHSFDRRLACIRMLKRLGYVTGSGVMIGLPGQTHEDLERDLDWFVDERLDMVGMGPYIPAEGTPLECREEGRGKSEALRLEETLWMIRETRRRMPEINIVAATALEVLSPEGRELGFANGANVFMPNLTPEKYRVNYELYPGKTVVSR